MKIKSVLIRFLALVLILFAPSFIFAKTESSISFSKSKLFFSTEKSYTRIQLADSRSLAQVGAPELPQKGISLVLPQNVKVEGVRILSYQRELIEGEFYLYPTQEKVPIGYPPAPFAQPDPLIYESDLPYPGKIMEVTGDGYMEGFHLVHVLVYPIEYIPKQRKLYLYTDIEFEIEYVDAKRDYFQPTRIGESSINKLLSLVHNPEDVKLHKPKRMFAKPGILTSDSIPYVIITTDYLKSTYESLKQWKTRKGTKTEIITISEIDTNTAYAGVDLAEKIKNFIIDAKADWKTEWILFGGDVDSIPARYTWHGAELGYTYLTDHYYSCLDNMWNSDGDDKWAEPFGDITDLEPDGIYVGRVPLNGIDDTENFLDKLLSYERDSPDTNYQTRSLFLSSILFWDDEAKEWCDTVATTIPGNFQISGPCFEYGKTKGIDSLNLGFGIVVNCSHAQHSGNFLACYDFDICYEAIEKTDIFSLTNTNRYSIMFNATCLNNKLDEDCLSKYFIKNPSGGGVGYIGTAGYEYYFESRDQGKEFFNQIFDNEATLGEAFMNSKLIFLPHAQYNTTERTRIMTYILLGDPQMEVWTETPLEIAQNIDPPGVDTGMQTIEVCVKEKDIMHFLEGAKVCLTKDDDVYKIKHTVDDSSRPICPIPASFDTIYFPTPGWAHFVASKKNCIPVEDSIPIGYPTIPYNISATAWACHSIVLQWDDSSCNEQGFEIMRKEHNDTAWSQIATVGYNVESYNDTDVDTNHVYFYRIRAYNNVGYSDYSDIVDDMDSLCEEPGCPFVYVWNGEGFINDNVILTCSEDDHKDKSFLSDYYILSQGLEPKDGKYELEIIEFENEISRIDHLNLFAIDYPQNEKIGVTTQGKVWIYSDPTSPISCIDQNGVDHLSEIVSKDKNYFSTKKPGYLIVNFGKLNNPGLPKPSGQMGSGGGGGFDPPPKQPQKLAPPGTGGSNANKANIVYIDVIGENGDWANVARIYPRTRPVQTLVELSQYVNPNEDFKIKISWNNSYSADYIAYYKFEDTQLTITQLDLLSAIHSVEGDINSLLNHDDDQRITLSPDQAIELSFSTLPDDSTKIRSFLFMVKGYYEEFEVATANSQNLAKGNIPNMNQNYPNPFNLSTEIRYTLPVDAKVTLNIYNILGQKVKTLVDEEKSSGTHTIFWDGTDKSGAEVASGIYFYQLKAGEYKKLKKMLLIK
ncbi:MAG: C25 family cysteine peptidase [Promethearchaeota archaeon]